MANAAEARAWMAAFHNPRYLHARGLHLASVVAGREAASEQIDLWERWAVINHRDSRGAGGGAGVGGALAGGGRGIPGCSPGPRSPDRRSGKRAAPLVRRREPSTTAAGTGYCCSGQR